MPHLARGLEEKIVLRNNNTNRSVLNVDVERERHRYRQKERERDLTGSLLVRAPVKG